MKDIYNLHVTLNQTGEKRMVIKALGRMEILKGFIQIPAKSRKELIRDIPVPTKTLLNGEIARLDSYGRLWSSSLKGKFLLGSQIQLTKTKEGFQVELADTSHQDSFSSQKCNVGKEYNKGLTLLDWTEKFLNKIVQGDSATLLKEIPPNQIDLIITSPPYFRQREYGNLENEIGNEETVEQYIQNVMKVFNECVRITKSSGSIIFNIGDTYDDGNLLLVPFRFAIEAQKNKEVRLINVVTWVKKNPTPRQFKRRLVPSTEPFFHFVKSDNYNYDFDRWLEENSRRIEKRTLENNIGKGYFKLIEKADLTKEQKEKAKEDLQETIEEVRQGKIASFRMKIRGLHAPAFGGQEGGRQIQLEKQGYTIIKIYGNIIKRDVIESAVETIKGRIHPAIYPRFIVEQFVKLTTEPNDIVLDPFVGSGTTCVASKKLGRKCVGIDINPNYCEYAEKRLKALPSRMDLFF